MDSVEDTLRVDLKLIFNWSRPGDTIYQYTLEGKVAVSQALCTSKRDQLFCLVWTWS